MSVEQTRDLQIGARVERRTEGGRQNQGVCRADLRVKREGGSPAEGNPEDESLAEGEASNRDAGQMQGGVDTRQMQTPRRR